MRILARPHQLPARLAAGTFILNSGLTKRKADKETAAMVHGMAAGTYPLVRSGQIKAYAMMAKTRWWAAPDVPTMEEAGVPGLYASFWHGLWVPKGTSENVIASLNSAVRSALADPAVRQRFADQGQAIPAPEQQSPEALGAHQRAEIKKWWPVIKAAGIKAE